MQETVEPGFPLQNVRELASECPKNGCSATGRRVQHPKRATPDLNEGAMLRAELGTGLPTVHRMRG